LEEIKIGERKQENIPNINTKGYGRAICVLT
jgi:hypothetical protein